MNDLNESNELPAVVDACDFISQEIPEPPQIIHGVLHQGSKLCIGGASKSHKTWVLLDMAVSVAHELPWLSFPTTKGRVLYVNFELQNFAFQRRIRSVAEAKGITIERGMFEVLNLRGYAASYLTLIPKIQEMCVRKPFSLIVIDPTYKLLGGVDENATADVSELLNSFERLAVSSRSAIAFASHYSKGNQAGKSSIDRVSGSGVFARDPDSLIAMTEHEEPGAFTIETTLRNFSPVSPFVVKWEFPVMVPGEGLDPSKLKQAKGGRAKVHKHGEILAHIVGSSEKNPIAVSAWAEVAKINRTTLMRYLPEMRSKGWIMTIGEGNTARQYITPKGTEEAKKEAE